MKNEQKKLRKISSSVDLQEEFRYVRKTVVLMIRVRIQNKMKSANKTEIKKIIVTVKDDSWRNTHTQREKENWNSHHKRNLANVLMMIIFMIIDRYIYR